MGYAENQYPAKYSGLTTQEKPFYDDDDCTIDNQLLHWKYNESIKRSKGMNGHKKFFIFLVGFLLAFTLGLGATGSAEEAREDATETMEEAAGKGYHLPVKDQEVTLSFWLPLGADAAASINSWEKNLTFQKVQEYTGIDIEFVSPTQQEAQQAFNLMIVSDDLTDILSNPTIYPGGLDKGVKDGYFMRLNELIDEYAPNYKKALIKHDVMKQAITDAGNMVIFNRITVSEPTAWSGVVARGDLLDKIDVENPQTIDEWGQVLRKFKNELGVKIPLLTPSINHWIWNSNSYILSAFDTSMTFLNKDGTAVYGPYEPGFEDFLTLMNEWYEEGLLDKDFASRSMNSYKAMISSGDAGFSIIGVNWIDNLQNAGEGVNPDFRLDPILPPKLDENDVTKIRTWDSKFPLGITHALTTVCKHPEYATRLFDFLFTNDGYLLSNYGVEGVTYEIEDKTPPDFAQEWLPEQFKDKTITFTDLIYNNPEGLTRNQAWGKYLWFGAPTLSTWVYPNTPISKIRLENTWTSADAEWVMPPTNLSPDESEKLSTLMGDIETYVEENAMKFIMGVRSLDEYDQFTTQLKRLGVEEAIQIQQNALNRYLSR